MSGTARFDYEQCMRTRQHLLQAYLAIPADAVEDHWALGRIRSRDLAKGPLLAWLNNATARLRANRHASA